MDNIISNNGKRQIQFQYIVPDGYAPAYCNGAYGGVTPQGDIIANFYLERMPIPQKLIHDLNPDGSLSEVVEAIPDDSMARLVRYVFSGIILTESNARSIHDWLGEQILELERRRTFQCPADEIVGDPNG